MLSNGLCTDGSLRTSALTILILLTAACPGADPNDGNNHRCPISYNTQWRETDLKLDHTRWTFRAPQENRATERGALSKRMRIPSASFSFWRAIL